MSLFNKFIEFSYPPESDSGTPAISNDIDDAIKFLSGDDDDSIVDDKKAKVEDKKEDKEVKEPKEDEEDIEDKDEEDEDEVEDLDEIEEEIDGPDEDKLELTVPVRRATILKKYPNLFKDFPYLEKAYYREQQFTELLPTIDDAKSAVEAKSTLDAFEADLESGNIETILQSVKNTNPKSFDKVVDGYLTTLHKIDERGYYHVIGNVVKQVILNMVGEANKRGNDDLKTAAALLNQFVFNTSEFEAPTKLVSEKVDTSREDAIKAREREFDKRQFETAKSNLDSKVSSSLKKIIESNIDPRSSMTEYVRKMAVRDAMETVERLLSRDSRFKAIIDKGWEKAFTDKFSNESLDRIRLAYRSKAQTLLPSVIKKARIEALKGMGKRVNEKEDNTEDNSDSTQLSPAKKEGQPRPRSGGRISKPSDIPAGMSTLDFLNSD